MKPFSNFTFFFALALYLVTRFTPGIAIAINVEEHNLPHRPSGEAGDIFAPLDVLHAPRAPADDVAEDTPASGYVHVSFGRSIDHSCLPPDDYDLQEIIHRLVNITQGLSSSNHSDIGDEIVQLLLEPGNAQNDTQTLDFDFASAYCQALKASSGNGRKVTFWDGVVLALKTFPSLLVNTAADAVGAKPPIDISRN